MRERERERVALTTHPSRAPCELMKRLVGTNHPQNLPLSSNLRDAFLLSFISGCYVNFNGSLLQGEMSCASKR